jgi:hypothetical protein
VIWVDTDYEADAMCAALKAIAADRLLDVRGSMPAEIKEAKLERFSSSAEPLWLVTKPSIAGWGLNWQHCCRMAFAGRSYSYEAWYQAVRRAWRFGQAREVHVHLAVAEGEEVIGRVIDRKADDHRRMQRQMIEAMGRQRGAGSQAVVAYAPTWAGAAPEWLGGGPVLALDERRGRDFVLYNGDCVKVLEQIPDDSIDLAIYSPPFSNLYVYSDSSADMGNAANDEEFFRQYRFLCEELYRTLRPGRLAVVHCKHLVYYKNANGTAGLRDFPGDLARVHASAGFDLHSPPVQLWRSPVREMTKTKAHGLLYKQLRADSTFSRQGLPEYLLVLRKWAQTEEETELVRPVTHTKESFPLDQWQQWASSVWGYEAGDELRETDVLQATRDPKDEKHICPMPLDVIRRAITLWSNPGDIVCSPFTGIGSEGYEALRLRRRFLGIELKPGYFRQSAEWLEGVDRQQVMFGGAA